MKEANPHLEADSRFPSGKWSGFFLQQQLPGRHMMELLLTFQNGHMTGEGRDWVGVFHIKGRYSVADGKAHWTKSYPGRHDVFYSGYNEGKGIWGKWEIPPQQNFGMHWHGGFHIWPEGMGDQTQQRLTEQADVPTAIDAREPVLV